MGISIINSLLADVQALVMVLLVSRNMARYVKRHDLGHESAAEEALAVAAEKLNWDPSSGLEMTEEQHNALPLNQKKLKSANPRRPVGSINHEEFQQSPECHTRFQFCGRGVVAYAQSGASPKKRKTQSPPRYRVLHRRRALSRVKGRHVSLFKCPHQTV